MTDCIMATRATTLLSDPKVPRKKMFKENKENTTESSKLGRKYFQPPCQLTDTCYNNYTENSKGSKIIFPDRNNRTNLMDDRRVKSSIRIINKQPASTFEGLVNRGNELKSPLGRFDPQKSNSSNIYGILKIYK